MSTHGEPTDRELERRVAAQLSTTGDRPTPGPSPLRVISGLLLAAVLLVNVAYFLLGDDAAPGTSDARIGEPAPTLELRSLASGETVRLSDQRGKAVLIDFWATTCQPCIREMPHLQRLATELDDDRFALLSVNVDVPDGDRDRLVANFLDAHGLTFDVLMDNGRAAGAYRVDRIPTLILVNPRGEIARVYHGYTPAHVLREAIEAVLSSGADA